MSLVLIILLFLCILLIVNSFVLYPLILYVLNRLKPLTFNSKPTRPNISILIAAHNEEKVIAQRIENIANLDYDLTKVEVFIGSDNSTDLTNRILTEYKEKYPWLNILLSDKRMGKAGILNELIKSATSEIVIFTDANTEFQNDALKNIVRDFTDEKIGGVCGKLVLLDDEKSKNEGVEESRYWKYETFIKHVEGERGLLLAANGGFFAVRKKLFKEIPTTPAVTDDLFISLSVISQGCSFTYRDDAIAIEYTGKDVKEEYRRKVRFSATNFQTLLHFKKSILGKRNVLSYAFFSHKVTRWFLPHLLILIFVLSLLSATSNMLVFWLLVLQLLFYWSAFGGFVFSWLKIRIPFFSLPYFFVISNVAIIAGFIRFLRKEHSVIWNSTER